MFGEQWNRGPIIKVDNIYKRSDRVNMEVSIVAAKNDSGCEFIGNE